LINCVELDEIINSSLIYLVSASFEPCNRIIPGSQHVRPPDVQADFGIVLSQLNVKQKDAYIICYDQTGVEGAARLWWYLTAAHFKNVKVLDGGLKRWEDEVGEVEDYTPGTPTSTTPADFYFDSTKFMDNSKLTNLSSQHFQLLVANKSSALVRGLTDAEGYMQPEDQLKTHFTSLRVITNGESTTITSGEYCGTLLLALHTIGVKNLLLMQDLVDSNASMLSSSNQTTFFSLEEPLSSYVECLSDTFHSPRQTIVKSPEPTAYKTVNVKLTRKPTEASQPSREPEVKTCSCHIQ